MTYLIIIVSIILSIPVLLIVHEFGHYLAARFFKVPVTVFCIGRGKPLFEYRDSRGTIWRLGRYPTGGFVEYLWYCAGPSEPSSSQKKSKTRSTAVGLFITAAGPFAEFLVVVGIFFTIGLLGEARVPAKIGQIIPDSPIAQAGLTSNDTIISVNGDSVTGWNDVFNHINSSDSPAVTLGTSFKKYQLILPKKPANIEYFGNKELGMFPDLSHYNLTIRSVLSPFAVEGGAVSGDVITKINNTRMNNWGMVNYSLIQHAGATVTIEVRRQGSAIVLPMTLHTGKRQLAIAGLIPEFDALAYNNSKIIVFPGFWSTLSNFGRELLNLLIAVKDIFFLNFGITENFNHAFAPSALESIIEIIRESPLKIAWGLIGLLAQR